VPTAPTFGRRHMGWPSAHGVSPVVRGREGEMNRVVHGA
jgi:hypothetical protein